VIDSSRRVFAFTGIVWCRRMMAACVSVN